MDTMEVFVHMPPPFALLNSILCTWPSSSANYLFLLFFVCLFVFCCCCFVVVFSFLHIVRDFFPCFVLKDWKFGEMMLCIG